MKDRHLLTLSAILSAFGLAVLLVGLPMAICGITVAAFIALAAK